VFSSKAHAAALVALDCLARSLEAAAKDDPWATWGRRRRWCPGVGDWILKNIGKHLENHGI